MATRYVTIIKDKHQFGDEPGYFASAGEIDVQFMGEKNTYGFNLPDVDVNQPATIWYDAFDVDWNKNTMLINGRWIDAAFSPEAEDNTWRKHMVFIPAGWLRQGFNRIEIQARNKDGQLAPDRDDFIITRLVLAYQT